MKPTYIIASLIVAISVQTEILLAKEPVRIGGSDYPISTFMENGEIVGLDFDIVEAILKEVGITNTERILRPWKRILIELDSGKVDMVVPMVFTEERKNKYLLTPSIRSRFNIVLVRKNFGKSIKTISDLKGLTVGKCDGFAYQKEFLDAAEKKLFKSSYCLNNRMGLLKMAKGRTDALMLGIDSALYLINKEEYEGAFKFSNYRSEKASHVGIHKSNVKLYHKFIVGFEKAQKKGIIEKIIRDWEQRYSID